MSLPIQVGRGKDKRKINTKHVFRACCIIVGLLVFFIFQNSFLTFRDVSAEACDVPENDAAESMKINKRKSKYKDKDNDIESLLRVSKNGAFESFPQSLDTTMSAYITSTSLIHSNSPDAMLDSIFMSPGDKTIASIRVSVTTLIDAFSTLANENGWPYWLAHQDLLAWYWNKNSFTMAPTISIQVPSKLVPHLLRYDQELISHRFKLIVNPSHYLVDVFPLKRGIDIDAVFLDTKTGLEIEIYALYNAKSDDATLLKTLDGFQYHFSDIFPLRKSDYNGLSIWIPNKPETILSSEYGKRSLTDKFHLSYSFDEQEQEWKQMNDCSQIYNTYMAHQAYGKLYPRYKFTRNRFSTDIRPTQCVVTETRKDGKVRKITAKWPLPKLDDDNGRRRLLRN